MGNMFFDIGQLANYLAGNTGQAAKLKPVDGTSVDFQSFVDSLAGSKAPVENAVNLELPESLQGYFTELLSSETKPNPAIDLDQQTQDNPLLALLNPVTAGSVAVADQKGSSDQTETSALSVMQTGKAVTEVYDTAQVKQSDLKQLINNSAKPVPVKVELAEPDAKQQLSQLAKLADYKPPVQLMSEPQDIKQDVVNSFDQTYKESSYLADELGKAKEIAFDMRQLMASNDKPVKLVIKTDDVEPKKLEISAAELKELIESRGKRSAVEMPLEDADQHNVKNAVEIDAKAYRKPDTNAISEKIVIADLKKLIDSSAKDKVKVVVKSIEKPSDDKAALASINEIPSYWKKIIKDKIEEQSSTKTANSRMIIEKTAYNEEQRIAKNDNDLDHSRDSRKSTEKANNNINEQSGQTKPAVADTAHKSASVTSAKQQDATMVNQADIKHVSSSTQNEIWDSKAHSAMPTESMELADKVIDQLRSRMTMIQSGTRMTIDLKPESLGKINIRFTFDKDKLEAVFRVDNTEVKAILDAELPKLKHDFKIDSYRVEMNLQNFDDGSQANQGRNSFEKMAGWNRPYRNVNIKQSNIETNVINQVKPKARAGYGYSAGIDLVA